MRLAPGAIRTGTPPPRPASHVEVLSAMAFVPQESVLRNLPLGELVKQLAEETSMLVRQELELAKTEMTQKGKRAGVGLGELGGAGLVALYALGALTACFIAALALLVPVWGAALIVT